MANIETFDDFESTDNIGGYSDIPPFQFREKTDKKSTHDWLTENFDNKIRRAQSRLETYKRYQSYYKGIFWREYNNRRSHGYNGYNDDERRKPKQSVNFVADKVDDRVAQMDRMGVNVSLIPAHDEQSDINNAKACKMLLRARAEELGLQEIHNDADKTKFTFGHQFMFIEWDKSEGPLHPKYLKYKEKGIKIPVIDQKTGKRAKGKRTIKEDIHVGDVSVKIYGPDKVFPELGKKKWDDVNELDKVDFMNKWELKKMYPHLADKIEENKTDYRGIDYDNMIDDMDQICVRTFFHKKTKWLPQGAMIKYTDDVILEWTDYPYDEDCLPCVPDTDVDIYGELWGRSFITNIERLQLMYNNTQSSQARDYGIGSAPKWMMPKGSTKVSSLNNEFTIVEYTGPVAPKLETPRATNPQSFDFQDRIENKITRLSRTSDLSRGEPPAGVTANSALRFLDEQESRMIAPMEKKRKRRVVLVYKMMLTRMQQFYKPSDGRMVRVLGENNTYMIKSFEKADFNRIYDVKIENSSALPDTKTGKISTIVDLNIATQTDPVFRKEEIVQMLDLGLDHAFVDGATVALTAAKTVVESLLDGEQVPEPQEYDNFLVYYSVFDKTMQSFVFRSKVDPVVQETFKVYLTVLEGMMWQRAKKNAKFAQNLSMLDNYPMFFTPDEPLSIVIQKHMMPMQETNPSQGGADTTKIKEKKKEGEE